MLTARSIVITTILVAVLSIVAACVSLLRPPDNGGLGGDTYGTRAHGQCALFQILMELNVPVERLLLPPTESLDRQITLVFWNSHHNLVQLEPAYLQSVARWVQEGGRVVVAPAATSDMELNLRSLQKPGLNRPVKSILQALGLTQVHIERVFDDGWADEEPTETEEDEREIRPARIEDFESFRRALKQTRSAKIIPIRTVSVHATGQLSYLNGLVSMLEVPGRGLQVVVTGTSEPSGRLTFKTDDGVQQTLAATYRLEQGEVVVVGDPSLVQNRMIAGLDNSVLAVHLLAVEGRPVVFDEFYHGLTIRGNPLWLFTRRAYGVLMVALLTIVGLLVWRQAIFLGPPLKFFSTSRRTIAEYIEATSRFLNRGWSSRSFLLREVRDGVLWKLRHDLALPPGEERPEQITTALKRRDPQRAKQLAAALKFVDETLASGEFPSEKASIQALKRISACL